MLAAGSSLWVAALTVMAMDVRHVLYGPSLRSRIRSALDKKKTALWAFGLTDEVFAAATAGLVRDNRRWSENWMLGLAFTSWASWVCGTLAGGSGNGLLVDYPAVEAALGFMLPALFMSFLLASFQRQQSLCVTAALAGALGGILLFSIPAAILAGIVCRCLTALLQAMLRGCRMNSEVLLLGVIVGGVNYLFRYLPLRLRVGHAVLPAAARSACCWIPLASPRFVRCWWSPACRRSSPMPIAAPTLTGFGAGAAFWKTRSIIVPTLLSAFAYGLAWKITNGL